MVNRTDNRATAYYPKSTNTTELQIIENLRNNIDRRIVQFLLEQGQSTNMILLVTTKGRHLLYHCILIDSKTEKVVSSASHNCMPQVYRIINKNAVAKLYLNVHVPLSKVRCRLSTVGYISNS